LKLAALALLVAGCSKKMADATADTTTSAASADTGKGMAGMNMDADQAMGGSGVPAGYTALTDKPDAKITDAKYTANGGRWEVQTGPAHIVYAAKDSASGVYAATTTIEQLEKPKHPEAYGLFIGGQNLDDRAKQEYTYFLVRGTGEYLVKARNGDKTTSVVNWTASPNVPKEDASGKATYAFKVHVAPDTIHFLINDKLVAAVPKKGLSTNGVAGLRINHNLHVSAEPVKMEK
jgi:hypothetical protein